MFAAAFELLRDFHVLVEDHAVFVRQLHQRAFAAIEYNSHLVAALALEQRVQFFVVAVVDRQATRFKHDALVTVVIKRHFCIACVASIDVARIFAFCLVAQPAAIGQNC